MEKPSEIHEQGSFLHHQTSGSEVYAVFSDPQSGGHFTLTESETKQRLKNLQLRSVQADETQKAIETWPKS